MPSLTLLAFVLILMSDAIATDPGPLVVWISANVSLLRLDSASQKFKIQLSYQQRWHHRLDQEVALDDGTTNKSSPDMTWTPVIYVGDEMNPYNVILKPLFTDHDQNQTTTVSFGREIVTLRCPMNLFSYPFDHQDCPIMFTLSVIPETRARLQLTHAIVGHDVTVDSVDISLFTSRSEECISREQTSCVVTHLQFVRRFSYYCVRIYSPSFLIVVASLISLSTTPGDGYVHRFAFGAFLMFGLMMQQLVISQHVDVSSVLSIHIWMAGNIFFVFSTLVECAVAVGFVHRITDISDDLLEAGTKRDDIIAACDERNNLLGRILMLIYGYVPFHKVTSRNKVDYVCFLFLTSLYLMFVLTYGLCFLLPWTRYKHTLEDSES